MKMVRRAVRSRCVFWLFRMLFAAAFLTGSDQAWAVPAPEYEPGSGHMIAIPEGEDVSADLPLKHTHVKAQVGGLVSTVLVTQEFENPYRVPIEAVYVFPLPDHAAVYGMKMVIGDRVIEGILKPRLEARELYEEARNQGRTASLLDQERPNIFTQSVANILPGDSIRVELSYFHDLDYEEGQVEFVFPTVAGPRYIPGHASGRSGSGWSDDTTIVPDGSRISPPLLPPGTRPGNDVEIEVRLDTGVPFRDLETPSHAIDVQRDGPARATVTLTPGDRIPNKDFVLRWRTDPEGPVAGWLTHHDHLGGTFLLILEPESRIDRAETAPREYVFVIDASGSMSGFPLDQCKRLLRKCLDDLEETDTFQVILFAGSASTFARTPVLATAANVQRAMEYVRGANGGGGTEFLPALEKALKHPSDEERSRIVLFLSDGYIGYEAEVLKYMDEHLGTANLFPMGIGTSVNRALIDAMARIGKGKPFYLRPDEDPDETVDRFFRYVSRPSVTGIEVGFQGLPVHDIWPEKIPDLFAGRPVTLVGRFDERAKGKVTLTGWLAGKPWKQTLDVSLPDREPANPGLPLLWARKRIETLSDRLAIGELREEEAKEDITELSLRYSLVSAYTSFVAVDSQVRNPGGEGQTVPVPVPLPDQVSPLAAPGHAYVTGNALLYPAAEAMGGVLCQKQATPSPSAGMARNARVWSSPSRPDSALSAELSDEERKEEDTGKRIRTVRISGTLGEEEVRRVLEEAVEEWFKHKDLTRIEGTLELVLTVDSNGKVAHAWVRNREAFEEETLRLFLEETRRLSFPRTDARSVVHVTLSF